MRVKWGWVGITATLFGCVAGVGVFSCVSEPIPLGQSCMGTSMGSSKTCGAGAVCSTVYCRTPCTSDADCGGTVCIVDEKGVGGCRLKSEETCGPSNPCTTGLVCAGDGSCRQPCSPSLPCKTTAHTCWSDGTCHNGMEKADAGIDSGTDSGADAGTDAAPDSGPVGEVDPYEVTQQEYQAFLQSSPSLSGQPAECAFNTSYAPISGEWNPGATPKRPASGVDWCDAYAYCKWKGRRLCGKIGGGVPLANQQNDFTVDQWYNACSSGGANTYPYGGAYASGKCRDNITDGGGSANVGTYGECRAPDGGIYDMSGNIYEFTAFCDNQGDGGAGDFCSVRGGSHANLGSDGQLKCNLIGGVCRSCYQDVIGIRCCK